jgi:hypothetical protein
MKKQTSQFLIASAIIALLTIVGVSYYKATKQIRIDASGNHVSDASGNKVKA